MRTIRIWPVVGVAAFILLLGIALPANRSGRIAATAPVTLLSSVQESPGTLALPETPVFPDIATPAQIKAISRRPIVVVHEEEIWRPPLPPPQLTVGAGSKGAAGLHFDALLADPAMGCVPGTVDWATCDPPAYQKPKDTPTWHHRLRAGEMFTTSYGYVSVGRRSKKAK